MSASHPTKDVKRNEGIQKYIRDRFNESKRLGGRPLRILHKKIPSLEWILRRKGVWVEFKFRPTGKVIRCRFINRWMVIDAIINGTAHSENLFCYGRSDLNWGKRTPVGYEKINDGFPFDTVEALKYACKPDHYVFEGPDIPEGSILNTSGPSRTMPTWRDDEAWNGSWQNAVRHLEDSR